MIKLGANNRGGDMIKNNILSYSYEALEKELTELGFKKFNTKQIFEWLHKKIIRKFDEMTNISLTQRELIKEHFYIPYLELKGTKTIKTKEEYYFELEDGKIITTIVEKYGEKVILHLASQTATPEECSLFGVGATEENMRNLDVSEILNQIYTLYRRLKNKGQDVNTINFSSNGEPLLNLNTILAALDILTDENCLNISKRKIIITTAGIIGGLEKLMEIKLPLELHIKLHSVFNEKRDLILPINKSYPLEDLHTTLTGYQRSNKRRITFNYVMIKDLNVTHDDLEILGNFIHDFDHTLNLIPFKGIEGLEYEQPHIKKIERVFSYFKNDRNTNVFLKD